MSSLTDLQNIEDIKVPYPTEGVIRTAQLDDTVAPVNSVQLAVNMNFDRVGAIQTRLGVTSYADSLAELISNYGTLHNEVIPPGFETLFQLGSISEIVGSSFSTPSAVKIDDTKIAVFWVDGNGLGKCQNFSIDEQVGSALPIGAPLTFEASTAAGPKAILVSGTVVLCTWTGEAGDGWSAGFQCVGDSITKGTSYEFDATDGRNFGLALVDSTHVICFYTGPSDHGIATILEVNLSSLGVSEPGSPTTFEGTFQQENAAMALGDGTHFVNLWEHDGKAQCFSVNTGTWGITALSSPLDFSVIGEFLSIMSCFDGQHFVASYVNDSGHFVAQAFSVNLSTFAITTVGTPATIATSGGNDLVSVGFGDGQHFVAFYSKNVNQGFVQMYKVDPATFNVSLIGDPLDGYDFADFGSISPIALTGFEVMAVWANGGSVHGQAASFIAFGNLLEGRWLYAGHGDEVSNLFAGPATTMTTDALASNDTQTLQSGTCASKNIYDGAPLLFTSPSHDNFVNGTTYYAGSVGDNTFKVYSDAFLTTLVAVTVDTSGYDWTANEVGNWIVRRTGLAQVSKPRFSQYLNLIWMVNGNEQIGGDPVATSDGGPFGTQLVPADFPKGDFIHAGFEGRVWVANKTLGIIYYTDIVQFIPPLTYVLTYNPQVNFLSQIAPQTGETFTALFRVPRALLVFTENTITRIYGASSVDAYPAYNVGTFSQESIIETKTGIFFHHSSGFYQFDYGSQPVEISRRIIDFVKAIPRANYEDITGVYDGFDCVEWSVGQVVVEGVVFTHCVVRYTISTQVWTIYDYPNNTITAMIYYDDGVNLNHLMGTSAGLTGAMDNGYTDFGEPFYFEMIDRWRAFTDMYYKTKSISGFNVYNENAAGANLSYQQMKSGPNAWLPLGTLDENANSLMPSAATDDFDVIRLRIAGNTRGVQIVIHGIEITQLTIKGQEKN